MNKNQLLTIEVRSRHQIEAVAPNAVDSKIARSRHGTEVTTYNLLLDQKNVVATKFNRATNRNDVATYISATRRTVRSRHTFEVTTGIAVIKETI